jgi:hypothetical protein
MSHVSIGLSLAARAPGIRTICELSPGPPKWGSEYLMAAPGVLVRAAQPLDWLGNARDMDYQHRVSGGTHACGTVGCFLQEAPLKLVMLPRNSEDVERDGTKCMDSSASLHSASE